MATISQDFLRFLYANYPDDYRRASVDDVPEDVITAIMSKHARHYTIWKEIPEWIKNRYADRLPSDVLNGNETPQDLINQEVEKQAKEDEAMYDAAVGFTAVMLAAGYASSTIELLQANKDLRAQLLAKANGEKRKLTDEEFAKWLETRPQDVEAILDDWAKGQPEKYLFHLIKSINRERRRQEGGQVGFDMAASDQKIDELRKKLRKHLSSLDSRAAKQKMVDYLSERHQQNAMRFLLPDVLEEMIAVMRKQGIKIEPINEDGKGLSMHVEGIFESFKSNFDKMIKMGAMAIDMAKRHKSSAERFGLVASKKEKSPKSSRMRRSSRAVRQSEKV